MQIKDPYLVLGLTSDATQAQVEEAYARLKKEYQEKRFCEGEEGAKASRALSELEWAYKDCLDDLQNRVSITDNGTRLLKVEELIKQGELEQAQSVLDSLEKRDAEWHYIQAIIYYKRNWHMESKKQLEIAITLEPANEKYKKSYDRLVQHINAGNSQQSANTQQAGNQANSQQRGGYQRPYNGTGADNTSACCNTCSTLICCDCCCECMGGDLIACC